MAQEAREGGVTLPRSWTFAVAIGVLLAHVVFSAVMFLVAGGTNSEIWQRRFSVYGSIEAIVFTAVGWIFGREVHRAQAESARKDAEEAKADAKANAEEAKEIGRVAVAERERGQALKAAILAHTIGTTTPPGAAGAATPGGQSRDIGLGSTQAAAAPGAPASAELAALQSLARQLYGDEP